ncbi:uncharacterized protein LOC119922700 isoform X3 [Tachyglossus aculeatus]|uniref:uncharacterized protein LOC119922700 isoform X3 n=1 Tax=Tachyglossus aculeatus TaxID=9261 RepID=UPI0018F6EB6B|nr:uncharacterized protein LOC119922700 isoform X3 [Tachyglossus aculeatus]
MEVTKDTWLLQFINGPASVCWGVPDDPTQKLHHLHLYSIPSQLAGAPSDRSLREALLGEISAIGPLQRYRNRSSIGVMRGIGSRWCNTGECRLEVDIEGVLMSRREGLVHFSSQKLLSTLPGNEDCCPFRAPSDPSLWEALLGEISAIGPLQRYHNRPEPTDVPGDVGVRRSEMRSSPVERTGPLRGHAVERETSGSRRPS